jgi:branched-chain amino acid transport system permease protein
MELTTIFLALVDGLALSMLLFMVASGFSLIFGLEGVLNFAHGSMFMLGAWFALETFLFTESLPAGLLVGSCSIACIGALLETSLLRRVFGNELAQILLTMGIFYIIHYLCVMHWGLSPFGHQWVPGYLSGTINETSIEKYKVFLIAFGGVVFGAVSLFLKRTKFGLVVRGGVEDAEMVEALGVNVKRAFTIVFALGCGLAGLGGAVAVPWLGASTSLEDYLLYAFAIVVIGGMGSFKGSFLGALLVGVTDKFLAYFCPGLVGVDVFLIMLIVLLVKPEGLVRR